MPIAKIKFALVFLKVKTPFKITGFDCILVLNILNTNDMSQAHRNNHAFSQTYVLCASGGLNPIVTFFF